MECELHSIGRLRVRAFAITSRRVPDMHNAKTRELGLRELASFTGHASAVGRTAAILAQSADAAQEGDAQPAMARTHHDNDTILLVELAPMLAVSCDDVFFLG